MLAEPRAAGAVRVKTISLPGVAPIDAFSMLRGHLAEPALFFDTAFGSANAGARSILAFGCLGELRAQGGRIRVAIGSFQAAFGKERLNDACRLLLRGCAPECADVPHASALGAYGVAAYEFAGYHERLPELARGGDGAMDLHLVVPEMLVVFDESRRDATILARGSRHAVEEVASALETCGVPPQGCSGAEPIVKARPGIGFAAAVERAKQAIVAGDVYQIVLSQKWEYALRGDPLEYYRRLRAINPSPYAFFLELPEATIFGSSPEMLCKLESRVARIRPLAGTRPRPPGDAAAATVAAGLLRDPKERAEHVMLVDLARNDLGRVCEFGSVSVCEFMAVEHYSHVMHIASDVRGTLRAEKDAFDLLAAAFPAGTVSGAPKIRAMQLIAELEGEERGYYGGAVIRAGFDGSLDTGIVLRSAVVRAGVATVRAGAGVVADSHPAREDAECRHKARAVALALTGRSDP